MLLTQERAQRNTSMHAQGFHARYATYMVYSARPNVCGSSACARASTASVEVSVTVTELLTNEPFSNFCTYLIWGRWVTCNWPLLPQAFYLMSTQL